MPRWALRGAGVPDGCGGNSRRLAGSRDGHSNRAGPLPASGGGGRSGSATVGWCRRVRERVSWKRGRRPPREGVRHVSRRAACRSQPASGQRRVCGSIRRGRPPREAILPRRWVLFGAAAAAAAAAARAEDTAAAGRSCGGDGKLVRCELTPRRRRRTKVGARRCRVPVSGAVGVVGVSGIALGRTGQCGARRATACASQPR